jgi:hypothetical protein
MAVFEVTDPTTGQTVELEGDSPPTEQLQRPKGKRSLTPSRDKSDKLPGLVRVGSRRSRLLGSQRSLLGPESWPSR